METISIEQIRQEINCAEHNWFEKFALKAKEPVNEHSDDSQMMSAEASTLWAHIWNGPHGTFEGVELIPGSTVVVDFSSCPTFYSSAEIMEKFNFTQECPISYNSEPKDKTYSESLRRIMKKIRYAAIKDGFNC